MGNVNFESCTEQLKKHLDSSRQSWLFGAGISCESNIPLMYPLTERVKNILASSKRDSEIFNMLTEELEEDCHIEHHLSHIGDLIAIADRSRSKKATINNNSFTKEELLTLYRSIISAIGDTIRYGYSNDEKEIIGTAEEPIVDINYHTEFVKALYSSRSNLWSRSRLTFFTTNYDTLLEDALGLKKFTVIDGFSGGAIAYWNPQQEFQNTTDLPNKCLLYKLHGSIDWQLDKEQGLVRTRYGTKYLADKSDIMIYPQATKYVETQKDPFSYLFNGFRNALNSPEDNVLVTCGYSFCDNHINSEIEVALLNKSNRTTLIAFANEDSGDKYVVNKTLDSWLNHSQFGDRVHVAGKKGIYNGSTSVIPSDNGKDLSWWTFSGLTNFISTGDYE